MASSSSVSDDPPSTETTEAPVQYSVRPGTLDLGRNYENKIAALLSLRSLGDDTKAMWLAMNSADCGYFDDIILYRQMKNEKTAAYLMQVKHSSNSKPKIHQSFTSPKGVFSLQKYLTAYKEFTTRLEHKDTEQKGRSKILDYLGRVEKKFFIIFTNQNTIPNDFLQKVVKEDPDLDFINANGDIYQINMKFATINLPDFDHGIPNEVYFFMNQPNVLNINEKAMEIFGKVSLPLHISVLHEVVQKYVTFIKEWSTGSLGGHYFINKQQMLKVVTQFLFEPYLEKNFYQGKFNYKKFKLDKWDFITKNKNVTIIDMNCHDKGMIYKFLWGCVYKKLQNYTESEYLENWDREYTKLDQKKFYNECPKLVKKEMLMTIGNKGKITVNSIYNVLCKLNQLPFILNVHNQEAYQIILRTLELSKFSFNVILLNSCKYEKFETGTIPKPFLNFTDLNKDESEVILDEKIKFQGRSIQLKKLNKTFQVAKHLNVGDIINIFSGTFNIGNTLEQLPRYYIKRKIMKDSSSVPIQYLLELLNQTGDDIFVIHCKNFKTFCDFLKSLKIIVPEFFIIDYETIKDQKNLPSNCRIITVPDNNKDDIITIPNKTVHVFLQNQQLLVHVTTNRSSEEDTSSCAESTMSCVWKFDDLTIPDPGKIKIIAGSPGIGKTTILNEISLNTPKDFWVVPIKLREFIKYYDSREFKRQDSLTRIKHITGEVLKKQGCWSQTNMDIFNEFLNLQYVVLTIDGFDEISPLHKTIVTNMLRGFKKEKLRIWLTTRTILKTYLEREFDTEAWTLPKFSIPQQQKFLTKYYSNTTDSELPKKFSINLLKLINETLNHYQEPLTGIPLHLEVLGKLFKPNTSNLNIEDHLLNISLTLMSEKRKIIIKKYDSSIELLQVMIANDQKLIALHFLFPEIDLKQQINCMGSNEMSEALQKDGIVVTDGNPANVGFVDQILAEYLVALWVVANPENDISSTVLKQNFGIINKLHDQMVQEQEQEDAEYIFVDLPST